MINGMKGYRSISLMSGKMIVFFLGMLIMSVNSIAYSQKERKPIKESSVVRKGNKAYQEMQYSLASKYYLQYVKQEAPQRLLTDILIRLADCQWQTRQLSDCLITYEKIFELRKNITFGDKEKKRISELYARSGQSENAAKWLEVISGCERKASAYMDMKFQNMMFKDSDCWEIWPLISVPGYRVFAPVLMDSVLVFSGVQIGDSKNRVNQRNVAYKLETAQQNSNMQSTSQPKYARTIFYKNTIKKRRLANVYEGSDVAVAKRDKYIYLNKSSAVTKDTVDIDPVNGMDGTRSQFMSIAVDKNKKIYFTSPTENNKGSYLMQGEYDSHGVKKIHSIRFRNRDVSDNIIHPAINAVGNLLVFSSNRESLSADYDLYYSRMDSVSGEWEDPKPLKIVNTVGNEVFPSITSDGYLYFSSDNLPGLGGLDIYKIKVNDALENVGKIEYLSYPINSSADDYGWTQYPDNVSGYFTTDRSHDVDNIYGFRYTPKVEISGIVKNNLTGSPINDATVFACDPLTKKVAVVKTDSLGRYTLRIKKGSEMVIRTVVNPYDTVFENQAIGEYSKSIVVHGGSEDKLLPDFTLTKLSKGIRWTMDTVFYDFNKWNIKPESYASLNKIVQLLKEFPLVHIEVAAYTDPIGSDIYNLWLSQQRANSVVRYLVNAGIREDRIQGRGYGKDKDEFVNSKVKKSYRMSRRTEICVSGYDRTSTDRPQSKFDWTKYKERSLLNDSIFPPEFFLENKPMLELQKMEPEIKSKIVVNSPMSEVVSVKNVKESPKPVIKKMYHPIIIKIDGGFGIQVGVFSSYANASRLVNKLISFLPKSMQCFVLESDLSRFIVRVGYFDNYEEAQRIVQKIEKIL